MDCYPFEKKFCLIILDTDFHLETWTWRNLNKSIYVSIRLDSKSLCQKKRKERKKVHSYRPTPRFILLYASRAQVNRWRCTRDEAGVKWRPGQQRSTSSTACVTPLGRNFVCEREGRGEEIGRETERVDGGGMEGGGTSLLSRLVSMETNWVGRWSMKLTGRDAKLR